jgi:hypothetical protein
VIADRDAQGVLKTTSTFGVATAARDHASVSQNEVPVDRFAYRGVKRFVELFVYLLQAEGAAVVAEKVWLENLTNPPQPPQVLGPFSSHQNLEAAEAMLNTTVDAAPAF